MGWCSCFECEISGGGGRLFLSACLMSMVLPAVGAVGFLLLFFAVECLLLLLQAVCSGKV